MDSKEQKTTTDLPLITPDQNTGHFKHPKQDLGGVMVGIPLYISHGRVAYDASFRLAGKKQGSKPLCSSADGIRPRIPHDAKNAAGFRLANAGFAEFCETCVLRTQSKSCRPLWELLIALQDKSVARLSLNVISQSPLEQFVAQMKAQIAAAGDSGVNLRICDFALTFQLEKRPSMKMYGLAYPTDGSVFQLPLVDGKSQFDDLFTKYNRDSVHEVEKQRIREELPVSLPVVSPVDAMLDSMIGCDVQI